MKKQSFFPVIKMQHHAKWFRTRNAHVVLGLNRDTADFLMNIVKFQPSSKLHIFLVEETDLDHLIPTVHTLLATRPMKKIIIHISEFMPKTTKKLLLDCFRDTLNDELYKHRLRIMNEQYNTFRFHLNNEGDCLEVHITRYGSSARLLSFRTRGCYVSLSYFYMRDV